MRSEPHKHEREPTDPDTGYIDLSKRRVSPEDLVKCEEQYEKGKAVDSILTQVAKKRDMDAEKLYEMIAWPLSKTYGHAYEAFRLSISYVPFYY
jgi:translation initiation factor 2 subunit 1